MIYKGDDYQVTMIANESLSGGLVKVVYRNPSQVKTEKDPTSVDLVNNKVVYNMLAADNNAAGIWLFWIKVTNGGKTSTSTPLTVNVRYPGN